jgi:predicted exporter
MIVNAWMAVIVWMAVLVFGGTVISRMTLTTDMTALLPPTADPLQKFLVAQLRDGVAARLILVGLEGAPPEALGDASRRIAQSLRSTGLFSYVNNGDFSASPAERNILMHYRYLLSPAIATDHFKAASLRASLEDQLRMLSSSVGVVTKAFLPIDPTGEFGRIISNISPGEPPSIVDGVWFSRNGTRAQLIAESKAPGFDLDRQEQAVASIRQAFTDVGLPGTSHLLLSGPAVFAVEARETIQYDSWRLSLIAGVMVITLLVLVYRSIPLVLTSLLPVLTGMVVGVATVQLLFGYVHGITLGFGATLIGEAVDYPAYLFTHLALNERPPETLRRVWPTLRLAVLTTVFGGLTMLLSSFTGLSQLGTLTVAGVLTAGLVTRWVIPTLANFPHTPPISHVPALNASRLLAWMQRGRSVAWIALTAAALFLFLNHERVWDDDLANLSPISSSAKTLDEQLRSELGAPDVRYLVVMTGASLEQVLSVSESTEIVLRRLVREGMLTGFELPSFFLPSQATQAQRKAALPKPEALKASLKEALNGLPFREGLFSPFLLDVESARTGPFLNAADLESSASALKLRALLVHSGNEWTALGTLRGVSSAPTIAQRLREETDGLWFLDLKEETGRLVAGYRQESLRLTAAGVGAITIILWWGLRRPSLVWRVLCPALSAILLAVATLGIAGERLTLFHLVSLLLVLGVGLNYALFFNRPSMDDAERRCTSLALAVCIIATLSAFGTLAWSRTPVLHAIGVTVSVGALYSLLLSAMMSKQKAPS